MRAYRFALRFFSAAAVVAALFSPPAHAASWSRHYINALPDSAFAAVETGPDGRKVRHLPHHDRNGRVDVPHLRNALQRLPQVKWIDPQRAAEARQHLENHLRDVRHDAR